MIKADGSVFSFGSNFRGQLGRGLPDNGPYPAPTQIAGLVAKFVSNGDSFVIVTEQSGTLKVFGRNDSGQLGLGVGRRSGHWGNNLRLGRKFLWCFGNWLESS